MNIGCESPPFDNLGILTKVRTLNPVWVRDMAHSYEVCVTGLGQYNFTGSNHGSAVEPPLVLATQKIVLATCAWVTSPKWINATNCIQELCAYVAALIAKYPGTISAIEPGNELWFGPTDKLPWITNNQDLATFIVALARQMRVTVKTLDPSVEIWGPSQANPFGLAGTPALNASNVNRLIVAAGGLKYFDKWSLHIYPTVSPLQPPIIAASLADLQSFVTIPIVVTECGIPDNFSDTDVWELVQNLNAAGCELLCMTGLWYSKDSKATPSQAQTIACWNPDGTQTSKLKALLAAIKSVNRRNP